MNLWEEMGIFLDEDPRDIIERASRSEARLVDMWKEYKGSTDDFYRDNKEYLYNLLAYNRMPAYAELTRPLNGEQGHKILDIGCGVGSLAFFLAQRNEVVGYDINPMCVNFANGAAKRNGVNATFTTEMPDRDKFDLVTAVDVLEHIEDLKGFLGLLGTGMKPLTRFFHQDCWWITEQYPMHFDHKDSIDQWLGEAGFRITSPTWAVRL